jgi:hypothetical protein
LVLFVVQLLLVAVTQLTLEAVLLLVFQVTLSFVQVYFLPLLGFLAVQLVLEVFVEVLECYLALAVAADVVVAHQKLPRLSPWYQHVQIFQQL